MIARSFYLSLAILSIGTAAPLAAQMGQSDSYQFLQAIKESKGDEVNKYLNKAGSGDVIINTRDRSTGEGAIHIVTKRGDTTYLSFLLGRGADANLRDGDGNTAAMDAVIGGYPGLIDILAKGGANLNLGNRGGETPLIMAVHRRDMDMVRTLIAAGADPDQRDHLAGLSARDYAKQDARGGAIAKVIDETPKKEKKAVAGPKF